MSKIIKRIGNKIIKRVVSKIIKKVKIPLSSKKRSKGWGVVGKDNLTLIPEKILRADHKVTDL